MNSSNEESGVESVEEGTWVAASSSSDSGEDEETGIENTEIDVVPRRGADVSLNIHGQLDLAKLQQVRDYGLSVVRFRALFMAVHVKL